MKPVTADKSGRATVAALVVTFNRRVELEKTVKRLLESRNLQSVLVVDNASTDDTAQWLGSQTDPRLEVLRLARNVGGAGGFEAGMRHLHESETAEWLLLMDDDGRPYPGVIDAFLSEPRESHGAWVTAVYRPDGTVCEMNRPLINPFASPRAFLHSLVAGRDGYHVTDEGYAKTEPRDVDGGSFVGLFVSRDAITRTGFPDGRYFIYGDDAHYSLDMRAAGVRIAFDPRLKFEHDVGSEMGLHPIRPLWKVYYLYRNQLMVYRQAAGPVLFWPLFLMKAVGWRLKARHYGAARETYLALLRRAVRDGLARRTEAAFDEVRGWAGD
ncbi:glycosyltransferase [Sulfitobacter sp. LCG007]